VDEQQQQYYDQAANRTVANLRTIMNSSALRELSELSLPEVEAVINKVAQVVPAGNVPAMILSGLARLSGRKPPPNTVKRDVNLLFRGVEQTLDRAVYGALFAGPAAVIWGYQNLLRLVGKDPDDAFPEGTWQFYIEYALREDTARHANETHGFDTLLNRHGLRLDVVDRMTAWTMTAIYGLHQYGALLENEWRERRHIALLRAVTAGTSLEGQYAGTYRAWEKQRPYGRGQDSAPDETYPRYRRWVFEAFLQAATRDLPDDLRRAWQARIHAAEQDELPAYKRQMSILAYLEPGVHGEVRQPVPLAQAQVGVVFQGRYYLIPACKPGCTLPADVATVRAQLAGILHNRGAAPTPLHDLARVRRAALPGLRRDLRPELVAALDRLRAAPVLLNFDLRPQHLPLSAVRQAERGIGDHALTIFDTGQTFVFDQSHIFFDGAWGAALAEILTNEAIAWAVYLHDLPPASPQGARVVSPALGLTPDEQRMVAQAPHVTPEVSAETEQVNLQGMLRLRKLLRSRNSALRLTVNDLLVLYRAIHAITYQPPPDLVAALEQAARRKASKAAAKAALTALDPAHQPPAAILIPVDASVRAPRDRLHPMTFQVPLQDLDLLGLHSDAVASLDAYQADPDPDRYAAFDAVLRRYLAMLGGFGEVFRRAKDVAGQGESASVGTIKLLAYMPTPLQRLLDQIPGRFDMLNDLIKGREVFSNVGAVAPGSTLIRFATAKDDNEKKSLVWGVITDAAGIMHISLRDFRPHVARLASCDRRDLAAWIAQDYLESYALGVNGWVKDIERLTTASQSPRLRLDNLP
jgi:hypothetical protein